MKSIKTLAFAAFAVMPFVAMPAMAQSNVGPPDQHTTGTPGGAVTTQSGKTVQAPPQPPNSKRGGTDGQ